MSFEGVDYYDLDAWLEEDERAVRDMVRDWVDQELLPIINHHYLRRTFPTDLISRHADNGRREPEASLGTTWLNVRRHSARNDSS